MKLENQVVSLELAKKLKELGVKQESYFYFSNEKGKLVASSYPLTHKHLDFISAFTAEEVMEFMPKGVNVSKGLAYGHYIVEFGKNWGKESFEVLNPNESLADSLAKMLIHLKENKTI